MSTCCCQCHAGGCPTGQDLKTIKRERDELRAMLQPTQAEQHRDELIKMVERLADNLTAHQMEDDDRALLAEADVLLRKVKR